MTTYYKILHYPHVLLRKKSTPVEKFTPGLKSFLQDFIATAQAFDGAGLAAPQIGILKRICIADIRYALSEENGLPKEFGGSIKMTKNGQEIPLSSLSSPYLVLINPQILKQEEPAVYPFDGCLSLPDVIVGHNTQRYRNISISFQNADGETFLLESEHFHISTCLQHEIDHLEGTLYIDRAVKKDFSESEVIAEIQAFEEDPQERKKIKKLKPVDARAIKFDFL